MGAGGKWGAVWSSARIIRSAEIYEKKGNETTLLVSDKLRTCQPWRWMPAPGGTRVSAVLRSTLGAHSDDSFIDWLRARGRHPGQHERRCGGQRAQADCAPAGAHADRLGDWPRHQSAPICHPQFAHLPNGLKSMTASLRGRCRARRTIPVESWRLRGFPDSLPRFVLQTPPYTASSTRRRQSRDPASAPARCA